MGETLVVLKATPFTYVKCVENPLREPFRIGKFYKIMPGNRVKDDKGEIVHSLARFEPITDAYFNAFK